MALKSIFRGALVPLPMTEFRACSDPRQRCLETSFAGPRASPSSSWSRLASCPILRYFRRPSIKHQSSKDAHRVPFLNGDVHQQIVQKHATWMSTRVLPVPSCQSAKDSCGTRQSSSFPRNEAHMKPSWRPLPFGRLARARSADEKSFLKGPVADGTDTTSACAGALRYPISPCRWESSSLP